MIKLRAHADDETVMWSKSKMQRELGLIKYQAHISALDEHKRLLNQVHETPSEIDMVEIRYSLEKIALTFEEYFKVLGIP